MGDIIQVQKQLYKNHLEFLGYKVENDTDSEQNLIATTPDGILTFIRVFRNGIRIHIGYEVTEKAKNFPIALLKRINAWNNSRIVKVTVNNEDVLFISMWYTCPYEKMSFGEFITLFRDQSDIVLTEALNEDYLT